MNGKDGEINMNEELLIQQKLPLESAYDDRKMLDNIIQQEIDTHLHYVTLEHIKSRFIGC